MSHESVFSNNPYFSTANIVIFFELFTIKRQKNEYFRKNNIIFAQKKV